MDAQLAAFADTVGSLSDQSATLMVLVSAGDKNYGHTGCDSAWIFEMGSASAWAAAVEPPI